jgi:hypothetical protein
LAFFPYGIHIVPGSIPREQAPGVTKDLMRHAAIATTFNVYGKALSLEKREANNRVVEMLLAEQVETNMECEP